MNGGEAIDLDQLALRRVRTAYGHLEETQRVLALAEECLTLRAAYGRLRFVPGYQMPGWISVRGRDVQPIDGGG